MLSSIELFCCYPTILWNILTLIISFFGFFTQWLFFLSSRLNVLFLIAAWFSFSLLLNMAKYALLFLIFLLQSLSPSVLLPKIRVSLSAFCKRRSFALQTREKATASLKSYRACARLDQATGTLWPNLNAAVMAGVDGDPTVRSAPSWAL